MDDTHIVTPIDPNTLKPSVSDKKPVEPVKKPVNNEAAEKSPNRFYVLFLLVIIAGVTTGYLLSKIGKDSGIPASDTLSGGKDIVDTQNEVGSTDTDTFGDTATGVLEAGGSNGEATHKLIREGGPTQTVYLISSIVDLDQYVGKKVEIWGQTLQAKKVGWLMDVGRLKFIE